MVYYQDDSILVRDLEKPDGRYFAEQERAQGWHTDGSRFDLRLQDQAAGRAIALAAEWRGEPAGYINLYPASERGAFGGMGLPEIVDFTVLERFQRRGVGSKLMDVAEELAAGLSDRVYLGVGLHSGYGSAQRMYVKRGYIPDGSGVWYGDRPAEPYSGYANDDDLVLYLSKKLR